MKTELYETETMAELCAKQGMPAEAVAIYKRLLGEKGKPPGDRKRWKKRVTELAQTTAPPRPTPAQGLPTNLPPPTPPGIRTVCTQDQVTVAWALPPGLVFPALELFFVCRTSKGIRTEKTTRKLTPHGAEPTIGQETFEVDGLVNALAAAGEMVGGRFVALARSRQSV